MLKTKSSLVKKSLTTMLVASFILVMSAMTAFAAAPAFTSATYDVGTGAFVITGTDLAATTGLANDIDPKCIMITDSVNNVYTLTAAKLEITSATAATITVSVTDKTALAQILNKDGTAALNTGLYKVNLLSGWNGKTSSADFTGKPLTVSGVTTLTSATYDYNTGNLVLTGVNIKDTTGTLNDITPAKFFTITDGTSRVYTLKSSLKVEKTSATSATVVMSAADKLELEAVFDKTGLTSDAGTPYRLIASYGWNGKLALASAGAVPINVSNYALPVASLTTDATVKFGASLPATAGLKSTKTGTIYVVTQGAIDVAATTANFDTYVTAKQAIKVDVKAATPTAVSFASTKFAMTSDSAILFAYAFDKAGNAAAAASTQKITVTNVVAPTMAITLAKGSPTGVKATLPSTYTLPSGNSLAYKVTTTAVTPATTPLLYSAVAGTTAYTSGADITTAAGVAIGKYLDVYELNASNRVVKYKQTLLTTSNTLIYTDDVTFTATSPSAIAGTFGGATKTVTVTGTGTNSVVFTVPLATGQTLTKGGTNAAAVTVSGTTTKTLTIVTGGTAKTFTITIGKSGYGSIVYTFTITP